MDKICFWEVQEIVKVNIENQLQCVYRAILNEYYQRIIG